MPANRSRTHEWRRCLHQVLERGGAIELALAGAEGAASPGADLIWRVKLLQIDDESIVVEQPVALGEVVRIHVGAKLVAVIAIGQNRWMFPTTSIGEIKLVSPNGRTTAALRIRLPETVERCQRRNFYRVQTASLNLPQLEIWPLLEPRSVVLAERASELRSVEAGDCRDLARPAGHSPTAKSAADDVLALPEVGPRFSASLLNIGGGGIGIRVSHADSHNLLRHKLFWLRIPLAPVMNEPVCATGKLVHTHAESTHDLYGGLAFDFTFNPAHQKFIAQQICRYTALLQQPAPAGSSDASPARRTA